MTFQLVFTNLLLEPSEPSFLFWSFTKAFGLAQLRDKTISCSSEAESRVSSSPSEDADSDNHEMWVKLMTSENDKSHGSLFLRIGAIAFGLGTLIYTGLEVLTFFEIPKTCSRWSVLLGVNPVLYMIFVFMQVIYSTN